MTYYKHLQPEGNYFDKYHSKNPFIKIVMKNFFHSFDIMLNSINIIQGRILEAGCGEGNISSFLQKKYKAKNVSIDAFDISEKIILDAKQSNSGINYFVYDILEPFRSVIKYDLIICSEVLEHLEYPEKAINNLKELGDFYIFSVPYEPIWRIVNMIRGKYLKDLGNTPGHIQHFTKNKFKEMLTKSGIQIIKYSTPFPWQMVLCKKI